MKINTCTPRYDLREFIARIDTPLSTQRGVKGLFVENQKVADEFMKIFFDSYITVYDEQYLNEILRVLQSWKKYYGYRKKFIVSIMKNEIKPIPMELLRK